MERLPSSQFPSTMPTILLHLAGHPGKQQETVGYCGVFGQLRESFEPSENVLLWRIPTASSRHLAPRNTSCKSIPLVNYLHSFETLQDTKARVNENVVHESITRYIPSPVSRRGTETRRIQHCHIVLSPRLPQVWFIHHGIMT